jgi:hypothetical protein
MARVPISGPISVADLNTACGYGFSMGSYRRTSTSVKNNTTALVPADGVVSMSRLRGAYPSGTYRDQNILASSTTAGINVTPRSSAQAYVAGLSNNSDPLNAYTLYNTKRTGNLGYATQSNSFLQTFYTTSDGSQANGMYFRISNVSPPYAGAFEQESSWVVAIGLNYVTVSVAAFSEPVYIWDFYGGGTGAFAFWSPSNAEMFDGNNFFAAFVSSGTFYFGMVNRAQLRAGVIQPVYSIAMAGANSVWWHNSALNCCLRYAAYATSSQNLTLELGWDEYIARGYDLPDGARLYGLGDTTTRNQLIFSGSIQTVDGRIFE